MGTEMRPTAEQIAIVEQRAEMLEKAYSGFIQHPGRRVKRSLTKRLLSRIIVTVNDPAIPTFDWREKVDMPEVGYQRECYACTSFAISGAAQIASLIANPSHPIVVSAGYLHTCMGQDDEVDPGTICRTPVDAKRLLCAMRDQGYATGASPYPCPAGICRTFNVTRHLSAVNEVTSTVSPKRQLLSGPLIANMQIGEDFFKYTTAMSPVYSPSPNNKQSFLHCICVIGFNANGWVIRNSLGPEWGDGTGYATVAYGTCGLFGATLPNGLPGLDAYFFTL
jgi:hypothetical protein